MASILNPNVGFKSPRKLRVACIGSGFSGLTFIQKATTDPKYKDLVDILAYEKNSTVGGTWLENSYPGAACDIASHTYYLTCAPNPFWSTVFAPRDEIAKYFEDVAAKFELKKYIQFDSKVLETVWDEGSGKWKLKIEHNGTLEEDEVDFMVFATGYINTPKWPNIPGFDDYKGKTLHTAAWDRSFEHKGKKVAVLGNGASGIQAFTAMQPDVESITNYVRSPTWFSQPLSFEKLGEDPRYSKEEIKEFSEDPVKFKAYLKKIEIESNTVYQVFYTDGEINKDITEGCRKILEEYMGEEFAKKHTPEFPAGCRRLTPGINYLKALNKPNATLSCDKIVSFTPTGIETADGKITKYDLIVCATGFDRSYIPRWKMIGRNGIDLGERWTKNDPRAFKSLWVEDMPNAGWIYCAPRAPTATGSIPRAMSFISENVLSWMKKMSLESIKSMVVKPEVVKEYNAYQDLLLEKTVFAAACKSGYKNERGTIIGNFGGSMSSFILLQNDLHAECFDIKYRSENRFAFLGDGTTEHDVIDPAWYMEDTAELHRIVHFSEPLRR